MGSKTGSGDWVFWADFWSPLAPLGNHWVSFGVPWGTFRWPFASTFIKSQLKMFSRSESEKWMKNEWKFNKKMKSFGMPKPLKSNEKQTLFLILGHSKKQWKVDAKTAPKRSWNGSKNATKINEKVEGRRGKGRKGKGNERKREDRRGEGRKGEKRKPTKHGDCAPAGQRQLGGGLINLKGGDPSCHQPGILSGTRASSEATFSMPIFASIFYDILATFWPPKAPKVDSKTSQNTFKNRSLN